MHLGFDSWRKDHAADSSDAAQGDRYYSEERRIVRRVTIDGPVSVGIDGRHGTRRSSATQVAERPERNRLDGTRCCKCGERDSAKAPSKAGAISR
jgi:hypothetical protein